METEFDLASVEAESPAKNEVYHSLYTAYTAHLFFLEKKLRRYQYADQDVKNQALLAALTGMLPEHSKDDNALLHKKSVLNYLIEEGAVLPKEKRKAAIGIVMLQGKSEVVDLLQPAGILDVPVSEKCAFANERLASVRAIHDDVRNAASRYASPQPKYDSEAVIMKALGCL